ncbi:hypothetical protein [Enterocloster sp.]|uniref:hypothetical protein n=1 Tax=Enterocloster sp. TaxID=2719315 RepID=UPI0039A19975
MIRQASEIRNRDASEVCGNEVNRVNGFGVAGSQTTDTTFQMWPFIWGAHLMDRIDSPETVEMLKFIRHGAKPKYEHEVVNYNSGDNANQFIAQASNGHRRSMV